MQKVWLLGVVACWSCTRPNPDYCAANPDKDCSKDASTLCTSDDSCSTSPNTPICNLISGSCVECSASSHALCTGMRPVCGSEGACIGCTRHDQCDSHVCLPDGSCGTQDNVAFVDPFGGANINCSYSQPCAKVADAMSTARPYVLIHGSVSENVVLTDKSITVLADGGSLTASTTGPVITISGTSLFAGYDLRIHGAAGSTGNGIYADNSAVNSKVVLRRVRVELNQQQGIRMAEGALDVDQSVVFGNLGGGVYLQGPFSVTNSLFVQNGSNTSTTGGAYLAPSSGTYETKFEFNTVADNATTANAQIGSGVNCATPTTTKNNIVSNNKMTTNCAPDYSLLDIGGGPAAHNRFGAPRFKNTGQVVTVPDFYRLAADSPAIDGADGSVPTNDIDGDTRPQGGAPDIGADEYK